VSLGRLIVQSLRALVQPASSPPAASALLCNLCAVAMVGCSRIWTKANQLGKQTVGQLLLTRQPDWLQTGCRNSMSGTPRLA
jgi:hypothetical protein